MIDVLNGLYLRLTVRGREGQSMVEYGLIIALVAVVVLAALGLLGPRIASIFNQASNSLTVP